MYEVMTMTMTITIEQATRLYGRSDERAPNDEIVGDLLDGI